MKQILRKLLLLALMCALLCTCVPALAADEDAASDTEYTARMLSGICADGDDLLVTDTFNNLVWRIADGAFTSVAGCSLYRGLSGAAEAYSNDGALQEALFSEPWAIVPFLSGWAVTDAAANTVRFFDSESVTTAAGSGEAGCKDGFCLESTLNHPTGLAVDANGCLYIADTGNGAIRRLDTEGNLTTVYTGLNRPTALCMADGVLYIAETGAQRIVKLVDGKMTVVAGYAEDGEGGFANGSAENALFRNPQGLAVGADGTIYVADTDNGAIRCICAGMVTTLSVSDGSAAPRGLALVGDMLYCADTLTGSVSALSLAGLSYPDVEDGDWFAADVNRVTALGLLKGTDSGFEPDTALTRAMFVTILSRVQTFLDGDVIIDGDTAFPDLPAESWYTDAARWAADLGIVKGIDGAFAGSEAIQRQQLVTMLYRFAQVSGLDTSAAADLSSFTDGSAVLPYAQEAMRWAVGSGIVGGLSDGSLAPSASATRAQTAAILIRFLNACGI